MRLSTDEARVLGFLALLMVLAATARMLDRAPELEPELAALDLAAMEMAVDADRAARERRSTPLDPTERIDPNTAPVDELARLPGVGMAVAARIVAERERAPFRTVADLARVPGIGPRTLERMTSHIALPDAGSTRGAPAGSGSAAPAGVGPVDINRADETELQRLPGIGPALAKRIIERRSTAGRFRSVEELLEVPGIGPATLERLRTLVRVGG